MTAPEFNPGFRLSPRDILVLAVAAIGAFMTYPIDLRVAFCVLFVICHFFLFCNVFRLLRPLELIWSAVFLILAGSTWAFTFPGWLLTIAISLLATLTVITIQIRRPSYHGLAWQKFNPALPTWFREQYCESHAARPRKESARGKATGEG